MDRPGSLRAFDTSRLRASPDDLDTPHGVPLVFFFMVTSSQTSQRIDRREEPRPENRPIRWPIRGIVQAVELRHFRLRTDDLIQLSSADCPQKHRFSISLLAVSILSCYQISADRGSIT